ncbi:hypothetical protein UFOVP451_18 [uncultured Caudovirales phage]|uniref:Uncharacterized protein n=1 Tax=uncultured Caudovirales phage TaxID=2100421 RepID=A0A6J5MFD2_9CAUD|nr:hypothetical protein UFOVP451_18 [uncultured Caudovirales phage]
MVKVLKEKKGVPVLIEYNGKVYSLNATAKLPKRVTTK